MVVVVAVLAKVRFVVATTHSWRVFDSWLLLETDLEDVVRMDYV